jgi:hypothetical protein
VSGNAFCEVVEPWPEDAPAFERRIVREVVFEGAARIAALVVAGADGQLALFKKARAYMPRACGVLGREEVALVIREAVIDADGDRAAWEYVEAVLLPSARVDVVRALGSVSPADMDEVRKFGELLGMPEAIPRADAYELVYGEPEKP